MITDVYLCGDYTVNLSLLTGILSINPDPESVAREQRQNQGGSETGQDNNHWGPPHLAEPVGRGVDEDWEPAQGPHHGWLRQEKQVRLCWIIEL